MAKAKKSVGYRCSSCDYTTIQWLGKCPSCNSWGTLDEDIEKLEQKRAVTKTNSNATYIKGVDTSKKLKDVDVKDSDRIVTGLSEFDRVVGGGIVKDSVTILTAPPGTGKSTLLLQLSDAVAKLGYKVVYATGEESETQVKKRADRIIKDLSDDVYILAGSSMEDVVEAIDCNKAKLLILDSIQAFGLSHITGSIGDTKQVMECATLITNKAKTENIAVIMIGQMTKEDELAGSRKLEHLVDTVLRFEEEGEHRVLIGKKNRFGNAGEVGLFEMEEDGLEEVSNPSKFYLTEREVPVSGSALSVIRQGSRPILVEIESAVSKSFTPFPSRFSEGFRKDQLNILVSILEQRGYIKLWEENVIVKTTGGIKLTETSVNLAVLMSIASSAKNKPLPNDVIFLGEVGLTGELKKVSSIESRIREADRMGFREIIIPNQVLKLNIETLNIKITKMKTLLDCINYFKIKEK